MITLPISPPLPAGSHARKESLNLQNASPKKIEEKWEKKTLLLAVTEMSALPSSTWTQHTKISTSSPNSLLPSLSWRRSSLSPPSLFFPKQRSSKARVEFHVTACSSSSSPFDEIHARGKSRRNPSSKNSIFLNLIQEIEPLDLSRIQKDVPIGTIDAMKRTISSMLGLLPSDRYQVIVDASWESLSKLLLSSIMTGYTLRKAEYRLHLERKLGIHEQDSRSEEEEEEEEEKHGENASHELSLDSSSSSTSSTRNDTLQEENHGKKTRGNMKFQNLGEMTSEVKEYIQVLESRLSSMEQELGDVKRKNCALEMQHFVGEEKNDLLDYLRSLQPEKVVEISESSVEVQEAVDSVVHGLLATLSPKMHSKSPHSNNTTSGALNNGNNDQEEIVENTSFDFQPLISLSRDYLARLLFWCMLLGHFIRGLEYRFELVELLALTGGNMDGTHLS